METFEHARIDPNIVCHQLSLDPSPKSIVQRKRKDGEEKRKVVIEEVGKLLKDEFIQEIKCPTWLSNVIMVKKKFEKWRISIDFIDLNKAFPKDSYPFPHIDRLIDGAFGFRLLIFMDAYSGYNQICMNLVDAPKITFLINKINYYYEVMIFNLKNVGATYQKMMDMVFSS